MTRTTPGKVFDVEILSPRQDAAELEHELEQFGAKFAAVMAAGHVACIPDNPLGKLAFQGTELIRELALPARPGQVSVHVNTFHTKANLDEILGTATAMGIDRILAVSGDGSERLPKLRGADLGIDVPSVTSVELVRYIHREYPGAFEVGVAFNPYEPRHEELEKLRRKLAAGATFITTQPIIGAHPAVDAVRGLGVPVIVENWMSKKLHLLSDCVGYEIPEDTAYDPMANLRALMDRYPDCGLYLALVGFKTQFPLLSVWAGQA